MASRIGSLVAVAAVLGLTSLDRVEAQRVMHVDVQDSLFGEAQMELRRLDEANEEEIGLEVKNDIFVAQGQLKKSTTLTNLESYAQDQTKAVEQSRSIIEDPDAEEKKKEEADETKAAEDALAEEQKKEVKLDEDGNPILTDEELAA